MAAGVRVAGGSPGGQVLAAAGTWNLGVSSGGIRLTQPACGRRKQGAELQEWSQGQAAKYIFKLMKPYATTTFKLIKSYLAFIEYLRLKPVYP